MRVPGSLILSFAIAASLSSSAIASDTAPGDDAPVGFAAFIGTWTLEDDAFTIVWDGQTVETQTIPNHITVCTSETTASSVSCAVDGGGLAGQIFWVADETRRSLHHLSHFGERRRGVGTGRIAPDGSLANRVVFSDEPHLRVPLDRAGPLHDDVPAIRGRRHADGQLLCRNLHPRRGIARLGRA